MEHATDAGATKYAASELPEQNTELFSLTSTSLLRIEIENLKKFREEEKEDKERRKSVRREAQVVSPIFKSSSLENMTSLVLTLWEIYL